MMRADLPKQLEEIHAERIRAYAKHGSKSMEAASPWSSSRLRILMEELGEIAREFNDADIHGMPLNLSKVRAECVQLAAMGYAWMAAVDGDLL